MKSMTRLLVAAIVIMSLALVVPAFAADLHLGGGYPLWGTHTNDDTNHFDGGYLIYGAVDKEAKSWLSYGLMYNYARVKMGTETETTHKKEFDECYDREECYYLTNGFQEVELTYTTTRTSHSHLGVHVLGPYAKPFYKLTNKIKLFAMVGGGLMYVDGQIYGNELGAAGFASAGVTFDIYKNFGISGQMLYVQGFTSHVDEVTYYAPVLSFKYSF